MCICEWVCVCMRERERECVCVCVCVCIAYWTSKLKCLFDWKKKKNPQIFTIPSVLTCFHGWCLCISRISSWPFWFYRQQKLCGETLVVRVPLTLLWPGPPSWASTTTTLTPRWCTTPLRSATPHILTHGMLAVCHLHFAHNLDFFFFFICTNVGRRVRVICMWQMVVWVCVCLYMCACMPKQNNKKKRRWGMIKHSPKIFASYPNLD